MNRHQNQTAFLRIPRTLHPAIRYCGVRESSHLDVLRTGGADGDVCLGARLQSGNHIVNLASYYFVCGGKNWPERTGWANSAQISEDAISLMWLRLLFLSEYFYLFSLGLREGSGALAWVRHRSKTITKTGPY